MNVSKEEEFAYRKWRSTYDGKYKTTYKYKERFLKNYRKYVRNRECCVNRVKSDMENEKIRDISIKISVKDNCAFAFTTHMMLALAVLKRDGFEKLVLAGSEEFEADSEKVREFESITLKKLIARQEALIKNPNMNIQRSVKAFQVTLDIRNGDQFYMFQNNQHMCPCREDRINFTKSKSLLSRNSSVFEPPMCLSLLRSYVMSKQSLRDFNLKETLSNLLLPFVYILPNFKTISIALGAKFESMIKRFSLQGRVINLNLYKEYDLLKNQFDAQIKNPKPINKFIISGGFLLYLLGQTNRFDDVDIYIEYEGFIKNYIGLCNLKDSTGQPIWKKNKQNHNFTIYQNHATDIIECVFSLNRFSNFYRFLKESLGKDFHPPQLILYSRKLWMIAETINKNLISNNTGYYNLDSLMIDSYNIMDIFDITMCRNALVFLDGINYCTPSSVVGDYKRVKCFKKKINLELIDQFHGDSITINFQEITFEEDAFLNEHFGPRANDIGFGEDIYVAGISYQTGPYRLLGAINYRLDKYLGRCLLNKDIDSHFNPELRKLNYNVPRLNWLSYKKSQHQNLHSMVTCFCNVVQYLNQYKYVDPKYTPDSTFLKRRIFDV